MRLKIPLLLSITLVALLLLAACSSQPAVPTPLPTTAPTQAATQAGKSPAPDLARTDGQGAVEFAVTPLNLSAPGATLDFDVSMNTHSVDLGWDLAAQSTLATDTGLKVPALSWPVGSGHHYDGTLSFPATSADGKALLAGAKTLTLTIRDTDVPERVFTWDLNP